MVIIVSQKHWWYISCSCMNTFWSINIRSFTSIFTTCWRVAWEITSHSYPICTFTITKCKPIGSYVVLWTKWVTTTFVFLCRFILPTIYTNEYRSTTIDSFKPRFDIISFSIIISKYIFTYYPNFIITTIITKFNIVVS